MNEIYIENLKKSYSRYFQPKEETQTMTDHKVPHRSINHSPTNTNNMTLTPERLKAENPSLYQSVFNQGVNQERQRVQNWLKTGIENKWELRDALKSDKTVDDSSQSEIENFYGAIDNRLQGKKPQSTLAQYEVERQGAPDQYQEMEANDFYSEIDKKLMR
ncbi:hypothetical protein [Cytophaga sp. FL35]|uniref:hypothetical protein n=1 Tax=Cytophaga sp. FL35 TaxID=1904456 RepID=UPI0016536BA4|nr:hypothetical protein [Cytophaga sp. FL35]MBC6999683.1 hypothetical protein [Cytophaga sp. FL35]